MIGGTWWPGEQNSRSIGIYSGYYRWLVVAGGSCRAYCLLTDGQPRRNPSKYTSCTLNLLCHSIFSPLTSTGSPCTFGPMTRTPHAFNREQFYAHAHAKGYRTTVAIAEAARVSIRTVRRTVNGEEPPSASVLLWMAEVGMDARKVWVPAAS